MGCVSLETLALRSTSKTPLVFQELLGSLKKREKQGPSNFAPRFCSWPVADLPAARNLACHFMEVDLALRGHGPHARLTASVLSVLVAPVLLCA